MAITVFLDLHLRPEALDRGAYADLATILTDTRAFDGCLGVEVLIDAKDPCHLVAVERWASAEHDAAYRAWRATDEGASNLSDLLAAPPTLTTFGVAGDI